MLLNVLLLKLVEKYQTLVIDVKDNDILPIIKNLDVDKAHGWNQLSIRMIKICGYLITFLLKLIFKSMIYEGLFPNDWKKSNVVPIHKKE